MEIKDKLKLEKNFAKYCCEYCDFKCFQKCDWDRHIMRPKHLLNVAGNVPETKKLGKAFLCDCGKQFNTNSGLWKHKKICKVDVQNNEPMDKEHTVTEHTNSELMIKILQQNSELIKENSIKIEIKNEAGFEDIERWLKKGVPVIVDWFTRGRQDYDDSEVADGHYSVVIGLDDEYIYLQDPETGGERKIDREDFMKVWFDFTGYYLKPEELIVRQLIAVYK